MRVKKPCLDIKNEIPTSKPILETLRNHVLTIHIDSWAHKGLRIGFRIENGARRRPHTPPCAAQAVARPAHSPHAPSHDLEVRDAYPPRAEGGQGRVSLVASRA